LSLLTWARKAWWLPYIIRNIVNIRE
jgi:hypothetical protein